jgi:glyoxylate reductase
MTCEWGPDSWVEDPGALCLRLLPLLARRAWPDRPGLGGRVLGIVGFGRIGQAVAGLARDRFGMRILVANPAPVPAAILAGARQVALDDLLGQADIVTLHCPGGAANRHLIGDRALNRMRPDGCLLNVVQGDLVNRAALARALHFGTIAAAALGDPAGIAPCDRLVTADPDPVPARMH